MKYDFLQVTDELLDQRSEALGRLLMVGGKRLPVALEPLKLILRLERYVLRRVDEEAPDPAAEMRAASFFPEARALSMVASATLWPQAKADALLAALCDEEVRVMEECPGGWQVRSIPERYARFANERRAARSRARDNARARAAGWEAGEGRTWVHRTTGEVAPTLRDVIEALGHG